MAFIRMMAAIITWVCPRCHAVQQIDGYHGAPTCPKCGVSMHKK